MRLARVCSAAVAACAVGVGYAAPASAADDMTTLRSRIMSALSSSTSHSYGFTVSLSGMSNTASLNATTGYLPASTEKIFTGLGTLLQLGTSRQFVTHVYRTGSFRSGTNYGDLVLRGTGDPMLDEAALKALAAQVRGVGIRRVTGYLWADDTRYDRVRNAPGWKSTYVPEDSGPLSALTLGEDAWRTDTTYLNDPATANANRFRYWLSYYGVSVVGGTRLGKPSATEGPVTYRYSQSVYNLVHHALKESDNFVVEELLKELQASTGALGTTAGGLSVMWSRLTPLGTTKGTAYDGSGLSWWDRETPAGELSALVAADKSSVQRAFHASLPTSCEDGTLQHRLCWSDTKNKVAAKTGSLPGVVTLAGYTTTASGRYARFSFMLNSVDSSSSARDAVDNAVRAICDFTG